MTAEELQLKIASGDWEEGLFVDFKRELGSNKELCKDIAAFANSQGGEIFIGVDEVAGVANVALGAPNLNQDDERLRILNMIRDTIRPRLVGCEVTFIAGLKNGNTVTVVKIPRSRYGPHVANTNQETGFPARHGNQSPPMDVEELRRAFLSTRTARERFEAFVAERVILLQNGNARLPGAWNLPKLVIHFAPVAALESEPWLSVREIEGPFRNMTPLGQQTVSRYPNADGFLGIAMGNDESAATTLLTRNGYLEGCNSITIRPQDIPGREDRPWCLTGAVAFNHCANYIHYVGRALENFGPTNPSYVTISITRANNVYLREVFLQNSDIVRTFEVEVLRTPVVEITDEATVFDVANSMRPIYESILNSGGIWRTQAFYDEAGAYMKDLRIQY